MHGWKISFLLGWPIFRGCVSFVEGTPFFVRWFPKNDQRGGFSLKMLSNLLKYRRVQVWHIMISFYFLGHDHPASQDTKRCVCHVSISKSLSHWFLNTTNTVSLSPDPIHAVHCRSFFGISEVPFFGTFGITRWPIKSGFKCIVSLSESILPKL